MIIQDLSRLVLLAAGSNENLHSSFSLRFLLKEEHFPESS